MDTIMDIQRDRYNEWRDAQKEAMRDSCESCTEHTPACVFYDREQESYDYEECYSVRGWE